MDRLTANFRDIDWRSMTAEEIDALLLARLARYEMAITAHGGKRPKREGYIMEYIALMSTLREADRLAQKGKKRRKVVRNGKVYYLPNRHIRRHNARAEEELRALQMMILTLEFPPVKYRTAVVTTDAGKKRVLVKQDFYPWRILHHAILLAVGRKVYASLIDATFSCIKGKGLHYGVKLLRKQFRKHKDYRWFAKGDFKKFYHSIRHSLIEEELSTLFKDKAFIELIRLVLFFYMCEDQILQELEYEHQLTQRVAHWCCYEPNDRQLGGQTIRPPNGVSTATISLSAVL